MLLTYKTNDAVGDKQLRKMLLTCNHADDKRWTNEQTYGVFAILSISGYKDQKGNTDIVVPPLRGYSALISAYKLPDIRGDLERAGHDESVWLPNLRQSSCQARPHTDAIVIGRHRKPPHSLPAPSGSMNVFESDVSVASVPDLAVQQYKSPLETGSEIWELESCHLLILRI